MTMCTMRISSLHLWVTHGIIVVCHSPSSCGIYTDLVFLVFGPSIPTSFNKKMFFTGMYVHVHVLLFICYQPIVPVHMLKHSWPCLFHTHDKCFAFSYSYCCVQLSPGLLHIMNALKCRTLGAAWTEQHMQHEHAQEMCPVQVI